MKPLKLLFTVLVLTGIQLFMGCNPYKKLDKRPPLSTKDSLALAARCTAVFPNIPTIVRTDTVIKIVKEEAEGDVQDLLMEVDSLIEAPYFNVDSLRAAILKQCKPTREIVTKTITITQTKPDSAALRIWIERYNLAQIIISQRDKTIEDQKAKIAVNVKYKRGVWFGLIFLLVAAALIVGLRIRSGMLKLPFNIKT
jgi:hypothetical protein